MAQTKPQVWVTTVDNPFDPFTQWDQWYKYDERAGYHTCSILARLCRPSNDLTDVEEEDGIDAAIRTLLEWYAPYEVYRIAIEGKETKFGLSSS